ncbi:MAG: phasin family protein [Nitrospirae bacterium]|nr:phasin family protein [Nitrospirota bacterium]
MTIFDVVRNAVLAGFGIQEKVKEFVDDLVKKGELSESQGAKLVKEWTEKADKGTSEFGKGVSEFGKEISEIVSKAVDKISFASKDDIESLHKEIESLAERIKKIEDAKGIGG